MDFRLGLHNPFNILAMPDKAFREKRIQMGQEHKTNFIHGNLSRSLPLEKSLLDWLTAIREGIPVCFSGHEFIKNSKNQLDVDYHTDSVLTSNGYNSNLQEIMAKHL